MRADPGTEAFPTVSPMTFMLDCDQNYFKIQYLGFLWDLAVIPAPLLCSALLTQGTIQIPHVIVKEGMDLDKCPLTTAFRVHLSYCFRDLNTQAVKSLRHKCLQLISDHFKQKFKCSQMQ